MIARISLLAAAIAAILISCDTDRNIEPVYQMYFTKYYGEDGDQTAVDLAVGEDGSLVMVGTSQSPPNPATHPFLVKTDNQGVVLWEMPLDGEKEVPVDVELDSRNDILLLSNFESKSIRITRISQSGTVIDTIAIRHPAGIVGTAITEIEDADGSFSFLVSGYAGPTLVLDTEMPPPNDAQDLLVYKVDANFAEAPKLESEAGGEHVGKIVKVFKSRENGPIRYYRFGDSDRPLNKDEGIFRQTFEVVRLDEFFQSSQLVQSGPQGEVQISSEAIEMPVAGQLGYLMVGSTGQSLFKQIFVSQYTSNRSELTVRFSKIIPTPRSAEGVSVAYGEQESMFVLANELQDNNNNDIYLAKLGGDGRFEGEMRFGSVEGNDEAAAVRVLPDQRVAIFGTIELETQKKMMLTLISPRGTFSE